MFPFTQPLGDLEDCSFFCFGRTGHGDCNNVTNRTSSTLTQAAHGIKHRIIRVLLIPEPFCIAVSLRGLLAGLIDCCTRKFTQADSFVEGALRVYNGHGTNQSGVLHFPVNQATRRVLPVVGQEYCYVVPVSLLA
jgi:hypothetical protein